MAAPSFMVETSWPSRHLSPNGSQRNYWARQNARKNAKAEAFVATIQAMPKDFTWAQGGRFNVTIHAQPPSNRRRDADNLVASAKAYLDGIATRIGTDDSAFDLQPVQWRPWRKPGRLFIEIEAAP